MQINKAIWEDENNKTSPLMILLHGFGSNESDLPEFANILRSQSGVDFTWVSLRAPITLDETGFMFGIGAFAWMPEPVVSDENSRNNFTKWTSGATNALLNWINSNVEKNREIIALGFSQGGLMVSQIIKNSSSLSCKVKAAISLSGFICENTEPSADLQKENNPNFPCFFGYGDNDDIVPRDSLNSAESWFKKLPVSTVKIYPNLGHSIDNRVAFDVCEFLKSAN